MDEHDGTVVARVLAGDSDAFRVLVDRHGRGIYRLAYRMMGSSEDAEDIVQEAFLRAYRQLRQFRADASFSTWLHRIAANCAVDELRRRPRQAARAAAADGAGSDPAEWPDQNGVGPDRMVRSAEIRDTVQRGLGDMSPLERSAFTLRHFEGRSLEEIGTMLGLRPSATKHSIFRAVQKMRRALGPFAA